MGTGRAKPASCPAAAVPASACLQPLPFPSGLFDDWHRGMVVQSISQTLCVVTATQSIPATFFIFLNCGAAHGFGQYRWTAGVEEPFTICLAAFLAGALLSRCQCMVCCSLAIVQHIRVLTFFRRKLCYSAMLSLWEGRDGHSAHLLP